MKCVVTMLLLVFAGVVFAEVIKRETYTFQIDDKKEIDPEDSEMDYDHLTAINISEGSMILISVVDAVPGEEKYIDKAYRRHVDRYKSSQEMEVAVWKGSEKPVRQKAFSGKSNGMKYERHMYEFCPKIQKDGAVLVSFVLLRSEDRQYKRKLDKFMNTFKLVEPATNTVEQTRQ